MRCDVAWLHVVDELASPDWATRLYTLKICVTAPVAETLSTSVQPEGGVRVSRCMTTAISMSPIAVEEGIVWFWLVPVAYVVPEFVTNDIELAMSVTVTLK